MAQPLWLPQLFYNQRLSANVHVSALCGREHYIIDYQNCISTYLFDTQVIQVNGVSMAGKGRFDKNKQKLPGKLSSVYDYGNLNDSNNWYGLDCT